jgi:alpha-amylase
MYSVGEVFNGDPDYMCPYQEYSPGLMNYPNFYYITNAFQSTSGSMSALVSGINQMSTTCKDTTLLGSFIENVWLSNWNDDREDLLTLCFSTTTPDFLP